MRLDDFLAFISSSWPDLEPSVLAGLEAAELAAIKDLEKRRRQFVFGGLHKLFETCTDRQVFANIYRKMGADTDTFAMQSLQIGYWEQSRDKTGPGTDNFATQWRGDEQFSGEGNIVLREILIRHQNYFLNFMAIWFQVMLRNESSRANLTVADLGRQMMAEGIDKWHLEIKQYDEARQSPSSGSSNQTGSKKQPANGSSGCMLSLLWLSLLLISAFTIVNIMKSALNYDGSVKLRAPYFHSSISIVR